MQRLSALFLIAGFTGLLLFSAQTLLAQPAKLTVSAVGTYWFTYSQSKDAFTGDPASVDISTDGQPEGASARFKFGDQSWGLGATYLKQPVSIVSGGVQTSDTLEFEVYDIFFGGISEGGSDTYIMVGVGVGDIRLSGREGAALHSFLDMAFGLMTVGIHAFHGVFTDDVGDTVTIAGNALTLGFSF